MERAAYRKTRFLVLAVYLCGVAAHGAPSSVPLAEAVVTSVAGLLRALPPQYRAPIAGYLDSRFHPFHVRDDAVHLQQSLQSLAGQAQSAPAAAQAEDREVVESLAPGFLEKADHPRNSADLVEISEKLMVVGRVLAEDVPLAQRVPLMEAAQIARRELAPHERELLIQRMQGIAHLLARSREAGPTPEGERDAVAAAASAVERRDQDLPADWRMRPAQPQEPPGVLQPLNKVRRSELDQVKAEVMEAAQGMYEEAYLDGRGGIFPITGELFDQILEADKKSGLSQIVRAPDGKVIAFALAYLDSAHPAVDLEKIGVLRDYRKAGVSKTMLHALALRATELKVPFVSLLVVKTNSEAIPAYERLGFENVTPANAAADPRYNAFQFTTPTSRLLGTTDPARRGEPAAPRTAPRRKSLRLLSAWRRKAPSPEEVFAEANPGSRAPELLREYGMEFTPFVAQMLVDRLFDSAVDEEFRIESVAPWFAGPALRGALAEILAFAEKSGEDARALEFVALLARAAAESETEINSRIDFRGYHWPENPLKDGEFWDLASGPRAADWVWTGLERGTHYRFFDNNDFAVAYLEEMIRRARARGIVKAEVTVEKGDIRNLKRPKKPLAVLRVKNVYTYVRGGERAIEKMTDWIAPGGLLLIQNELDLSHRMRDIEFLGPMIERLIAKGWKLEYEYGDDGPIHALDLYALKLTKPPEGLAPGARRQQAAVSERAWEEYKSRVTRSAQRPPMIIFRLLENLLTYPSH